MRVRVYLATTEGPVSIDRITREPAVQSAVCLRRTTRVLPISGAYDAFVRAPSGVIERDFGPFRPGAFRIDLSAPVDDGESWQLAFYVAHDLARQDRLATGDADAEQILLLTGRVDSDRRVGAVAHVPEKLRAAAPQVGRWAADRKGVVIGVPPDNIDEVRSLARPDGVALRAIEDAGAALAVRAVPREAARLPRSVAVAGILVAAVFAVLLAVAWWSGLMRKVTKVVLQAIVAEESETAIPRDAPSELSVSVFERRAPFDSNCPAVMFRGETPRQVRMAFADGVARGRFDDELCALGVVVDAGYDHYAAVTLRPVVGAFVELGRAPLDLDGRRPLPGPVDWSVALPRRPQPVEYRLVAIGSDRPVDAEMNWLLRQSNVDAAVAGLRERGLSVIDQRIVLDR